MSQEAILSVCLGVALSAACGFRVFVPLMMMSLAAMTGYFKPSPDLAWVATMPALLAFAFATFLEVTAYHIPWLDNILDTLTAPVAIIAGTLLAAASMSDMDPMLKWGLAVVAGGGTAGMVHGATGLLRLASTGLTGGLANPVIATAEAGAAVGLSLLSFALPALAAVLVVFLMIWAAKQAWDKRNQKDFGPQ